MTQSNTIVVPTNDVQGNVTSCGIERVLTSVQIDSPMSFSKVENYRTYNVCTGETLEYNSVPEVTAFAVWAGLAGAVVFLAVLMFLNNRQQDF